MFGKLLMYNKIKNLKSEKGSATLVEYAIVFPLVLMLVASLVFIAYMFHQKAVIESATTRIAIYATKEMSDPNYKEIVTTSFGTDCNEVVSASATDKHFETDPYRYLFGSSASTNDIETKLKDLIKKNQVFTDNDCEATVKFQNGIFPKVTVNVKQEFEFPGFLEVVLPSIFSIETEAVMYVNQPSEFIRNADLVVDIMIEVGEATGITEKLNTVFSKIKIFQK